MYFLGIGMLSHVTTVQLSSLVTLIQSFNEPSILEFCEFPFRSGPSLESGIAFSCHVSLDSFNLNISTDFVFYDIDIREEHGPCPSTGVCVKVSMIRWRSCTLSRDTSYVMPCPLEAPSGHLPLAGDVNFGPLFRVLSNFSTAEFLFSLVINEQSVERCFLNRQVFSFSGKFPLDLVPID